MRTVTDLTAIHLESVVGFIQNQTTQTSKAINPDKYENLPATILLTMLLITAI